MYKRCGIHGVAWVLTLIGAINWGLIGVGYFLNMNWNVVQLILSSWAPAALEAAIYIIVGLSALFVIFDKKCRACKVGSTDNPVTPVM